LENSTLVPTRKPHNVHLTSWFLLKCSVCFPLNLRLIWSILTRQALHHGSQGWNQINRQLSSPLLPCGSQATGLRDILVPCVSRCVRVSLPPPFLAGAVVVVGRGRRSCAVCLGRSPWKSLAAGWVRATGPQRPLVRCRNTKGEEKCQLKDVSSLTRNRSNQNHFPPFSWRPFASQVFFCLLPSVACFFYSYFPNQKRVVGLGIFADCSTKSNGGMGRTVFFVFFLTRLGT
jgi:hypothetical protein